MLRSSALVVFFIVYSVPARAVRQIIQNVPLRPALVQDALDNNKSIYYFGLGSNMSRKKLEGRSLDGTQIEIQKMDAAIVPNFRLAFNLRGFPPLEPGMGSLEPIDSNSKPILKYHQDECHGALVKLSAANYEKVMKSEGIGGANPGYEEIVVSAFPYHSKVPVQAIALRARSHVRLSHDPCPSHRYMKILREGAKELGLRDDYQQFLQDHPVQQVSKWLRRLALSNLVTTSTLSFRFKIRFLSRIQSWFLFKVYVPSNNKSGILKSVGEVLTALVLLPGAIVGCLLYVIMQATGTMPPFLGRMMALMGDNEN